MRTCPISDQDILELMSRSAPAKKWVLGVWHLANCSACRQRMQEFHRVSGTISAGMMAARGGLSLIRAQLIVVLAALFLLGSASVLYFTSGSDDNCEVPGSQVPYGSPVNPGAGHRGDPRKGGNKRVTDRCDVPAPAFGSLAEAKKRP